MNTQESRGLPATPRRKRAGSPKTSPENVDAGPLRVIVCDDSDAVRERLISMIRRIPGVDVCGEATNAKSSLDVINSMTPDVAILDIKLPDRSGIDVLREINRDHPDVTVMMLTNHANALYRRACLRAGAHYFFDKSAEFERVAAVLASISKEGQRPRAQDD